MLAIEIVMNLAKIMLILNGVNVTLSKADANTSASIEMGKQDDLKKLKQEENTKYDARSVLVGGIDFLIIRHERSKQRRHANTVNEQHFQTHLPKKSFQAQPEHKALEMQYKHPDQKAKTIKNIHDNITDEQRLSFPTNQELNNHSQNVHLSKRKENNSGVTGVADVKLLSIVASNLNNTNGGKSRNDSNIQKIVHATVATHHVPSSASVTTTTLEAVTHKIRKLHKKKIVESLRQLNIDKFNTNSGHLTKNHHRSLLEAEHLQQQHVQLKDTNIIAHTAGSASTQLQRQQQQKNTTIASIDANSNHQVANQSNRNKAHMATNDIDTNESVNDGDLTNRMEADDAGDNDDDDDNINDDDNDAVQESDDSLSDGFYQNDDFNSNGGFDAVDLFYVTTLASLFDDKQFKNFSSQSIKDIDNNVDSDDSEINNETVFTTWQQIKGTKLHSLNLSNGFKTYSHLSALTSLYNLTEDAFLNNDSASLQSPYDMRGISKQLSLEPSELASIGQDQALFYEKEELSFNDSSDLIQSVASSSKDLVMDEAGSDDANDVSGQTNGFPLSELEESDSDTDTETETFEVASEGDTNHFLEGVVDAANSAEIYDWDEISRSNRRDLMHGRDVVTKFLQIVETQHSLGSNCEAGTSLNLGEGVVDRYAQDRFRVEAEVAVNRANMLTRIFKMTSAAAQADINLLHASVLSMVEFDDDIFAAGNCFDWNEHPAQQGLFCPFAYRLPPPNLGAILAKDLAMEYHYLGNTSEWFFQARKNAEKVIARNEQYLKAFHLYSNKTDERIEEDTLAVKYEDGRWSKPYYDCGGGNIWMLTYTVPFFGYENSTYHFKGTSGIDIDLRRVDIDQCPQRHIPGSTKPLNIFAGTDKCKQRTTMCEAIQGLGFRRGSYKCVCRKGYYFPDTTSQHKYFNGSLLEEEYEKLMLGKNSTYNIINEYECLPCAEGCDSCEDGSPCIAALNWPMRTSILALACVVIGLLPPAAWFTFRYQQVKVVRAASPALLRVIALGAFFIYCTNIVMYPNPNLYTCTARIWLREIGFSLTYGALMLKTWRISVIFRVRSAKAVKITDAALLKRLGCICGAIGTCLLVRTLVSPPDVVVGRTADDLKAFLCKTDWWDYTFTSMEVVFLAWGVRLCIMVRKAPSEFNESRFISMAIYNEFLLTCFLNVSMLFLQSPANPDLLYIIFFCHTQLTITLLLALIFGSKVYIVLRSGKSHQENIGLGAKASGAKFNFRPQVRTFANPSSVTTSTVPMAATTSADAKLSDQEALEEIRQLSKQLQRIQEMAPPMGVAVMTISSLLDGLKTPTNMLMATAAVTQGSGSGGLDKNQLTLRTQKPEPLPLLSLSAEMQNYQQLPVEPNTETAVATTRVMSTTTTNNNIVVLKSLPAITMPATQALVRTPTSTATRRCEEKAVNTEIAGFCIVEEKPKQQHLREHIVCQRCYEKCKKQQHHQSCSTKLDKCQILGSPQQEGSISFKNIKLDCMCSQSDDLGQLSQPKQQQHTLRRITKRTAATNTPPSTTRKRAQHPTLLERARDVKALSCVSLPSDESHSRTTQNPTSYLRQPQQQTKQQVCDNCKNKFKTKTSFGKTSTAGKKPQAQQHIKLSRLSNKCSKLIADIEKSKRDSAVTVKETTSSNTTTKPQEQKSYDCDEETQYSTDDIIFYTTTDTSDNDDEDDDDEDDEDNRADDSDDDGTDDGENIKEESDLCSTLSHSRSESRVPLKLKPHLATIELKCISLSLGNITTTSTATATSSTSSTSQPDSIKSKNALSALAAASAKSHQSHMPTQSHQQTSPTPPLQPPTNSSNGSNNSKPKRPDKLVLNLSARSKFTKEVSV